MTVIATSRGNLFGMPILVEADSLQTEPILALGPNVRVVSAVGWPPALGVLYAQNPLATLFGLLGTGLAAGYFIWGRNRSGGMSGFAGTPEEHLEKFRHYLNKARRTSNMRERMGYIERAWAESEWTRVPDSESKSLMVLQQTVG